MVKDLCRNGHIYEDNLYIDPRGKRQCNQCRRDANRRSQLKRTGRSSPWQPRKTIIQRLWSKTIKVNGCWIWQGPLNEEGYGSIYFKTRQTLIHRVSYILFWGDYPTDKPETDHLCRNRACWRPLHLEAVTRLENHRRSLNGKRDPQRLAQIQRQKTHCPQGHEYAGDNLKIGWQGARVCRLCERAKSRRYSIKKATVVW